VKINGMDTAVDPIKNIDRLVEIAELGLDCPDVDPKLQELAKEAAESLNLPIGVVSIVLDEAQYFIAGHGIEGWAEEAAGTPVEWSFCRNVVRNAEEFVVENAVEHDLMKDSPLVLEEGLRCYAGIPLVTSKGHVVGSFCVKGSEAREFTEDELERLRGFADEAAELIEKRRGMVGH
jgi:GAF domain-containing protein